MSAVGAVKRDMQTTRRFSATTAADWLILRTSAWAASDGVDTGNFVKYWKIVYNLATRRTRQPKCVSNRGTSPEPRSNWCILGEASTYRSDRGRSPLSSISRPALLYSTLNSETKRSSHRWWSHGLC